MEMSRELQIMIHLHEPNDFHNHPGRRYVLNLLDSFYVTGPNGRHLCLVLEAVGPKALCVAQKSKNDRVCGPLARTVSKQLLLAVDFLHQCGVGGTDIPNAWVSITFWHS